MSDCSYVQLSGAKIGVLTPRKIGLLQKSTFRVYYKISISYFSSVQMLLFYQMGDILHFSRSFSIFRQGSYLISLSPQLFPLFPRFFASLLPPFPFFKPRFLNFVRCSRVFATPPFPNTRKRCIPIICCNRQLEYSQPEALQKLYERSAEAPLQLPHAAVTQVYDCYASL